MSDQLASETDALYNPETGWTGVVPIEHARRLQRERNEARIQLANERTIADQLAAIVQRSRDGHGGMLTDPECFCDDCEHLRLLDAALNRWKEARK